MKQVKNSGKVSKLAKFREEILMSRAELARKADVSLLTISRIELGKKCRFSTMRKIISALDLSIAEKDKVF
jgi:predicted transcriptional regulator